MDLNDAFGSAFGLSKPLNLGTSGGVDSPNPEPNTIANPDSTPVSKPQSKPLRRPASSVQIPPEVYVLHVQIGRDDCHLLCMFLLVFTISFILSSRK